MPDLDNHNLTQPMIQRARTNPPHTALVFIDDDGSETHVSAVSFHAEASRYALALQKIGVDKDDLVLFVLPHSQTLIYAFWGAMYLGAIGSIFPFLTEKLDPTIYLQRVGELVRHSKAKAVITFPGFKAELSALLAEVSCAVLSTDDIPKIEPGNNDVIWPDYGDDKIALLQHSSGTTGLQKGVALSHRAVLNQIVSYGRAIQLSEQDIIVSWLPLYHDMGLIAGFVMPLVAGIPLVLMSPFKWVRDPKVLLHAIHRHRGTLCWLPNFAYNHSARAIRARDLDGIDLSSLRAWINCSEPVFNESHQIFLEKFAPCGVKSSALSTCYAMAENTFAVTQAPTGLAPTIDWIHTRTLQEQRRAEPAEPSMDGSTPMVSCGSPIDGTIIRILDSRGRRLPERQVGEIALRSNCMLSGYYHRPEITAQAIRRGWYHTGDMGYLAGGELYITGRKKDLIIVGGKNIYPQDLEAIANTTPGLVPGRSVAFGILDQALGSENIVMICEVEDDNLSDQERRKIEMDLRSRVVQRSEVALNDIRLVSRKWLIKTSSGKLSRSANREKYIRIFIQSQETPGDLTHE